MATTQPTKKNKPLRGLLIGIILALIIPDTRQGILDHIGIAIGVVAGVGAVLLMWGLSTSKQ